MDRKLLLWLQKELPLWQSRGWLTSEGVDEIRSYYGTMEINKNPSLLRLVVVILGAVLIALGIFLLFAGYWYEFSPIGRFDWMLVLVTIALIGVGLTMWLARPQSVYREGAGVFYCLAMGLATGLMGDTYFLGNSAGLYILLTVALCLPVAYLLDSVVLMILYLLGVAMWGITSQYFILGPAFVWVLLLLAGPYYVKMIREGMNRPILKIILSWAYVVALYSAFFFTITTYESRLTLLYLAGLAALTYGVGELGKQRGFWILPFRSIGLVGLLYVIFEGSFLDGWIILADMSEISVIDIGMAIVVLVATVYMLRALMHRKKLLSTFICTVPFIIAVCVVLTRFGMTPMVVSVLFNIYVLIGAILSILRGTLIRQVAPVNVSIFAILCIVLARFFDPSFSFVQRGVAFIFSGILVIVANLLYMWNKEHTRQAYNKEVRKSKQDIEKQSADAEVAMKEGDSHEP